MPDTPPEEMLKRIPFKADKISNMNCEKTPTGDVVCEVTLTEPRETVFVTIPRSALK